MAALGHRARRHVARVDSRRDPILGRLVCSGQSGALSEATADILGETACFWAGSPEGDWKLGTRFTRLPSRATRCATCSIPAPILIRGPESTPETGTRITGTPTLITAAFTTIVGLPTFFLLTQGGLHPHNNTWINNKYIPTIPVPGIGIVEGAKYLVPGFDRLHRPLAPTIRARE